MKCPVDNATLLMAERSGIEIDYCPDCRGVWLDRGELEKLIKGVSEYEDRERRSYEDRNRGREHFGDDDDDDEYRRRDDRRYDHEGGSHHGKKKRGGFMENIFDGFGD